MKRIILLAAVGVLALAVMPYAIAETVDGCSVSSIVYETGAGYSSPELAVEAETSLEVPASLDDGLSEVDGSADVTLVGVEDAGDGYLATSIIECDTSTSIGFAEAGAHTVGDYFNPDPGSPLEVWPGAGQPSIVAHWTSNVPTDARSAIRRGFDTWNDDTNTVTFSLGAEHANDVADFGAACSTYEDDVHWNEDLGGTKIARARYCFNGSSEITTFLMAFDSVNYSWCVDEAGCSTGYDLQGVAVHEWGHVLGFDGHFPSGDCTGSNPPSMCNTGGPDGRWNHARTLHFHDVHTTEEAYD